MIQSLPDGGKLLTLRDAANYITKLPQREHDAPAWRAAIKALMLVAEHGGDTMLPRIGIMRGMNSGKTVATPRNKYRVVKMSGARTSRLLNESGRSRSRALRPLTHLGPATVRVK